jgi:hypothetical protein
MEYHLLHSPTAPHGGSVSAPETIGKQPSTPPHMARKRSSKLNPADVVVTADRAARLYRILKMLGRGPQKRETLTVSLKVGVRDFYRDLKMLRDVGIHIEASAHRYALDGDVQDAMERLPFPDPHLTLGEAKQLAKGRRGAHKKLQRQIAKIAR